MKPAAWSETQVSLLPCTSVIMEGIIPEKNAFPESSLPTASLPKSALPFSLLLPAVKWMMKIPSCTAALAHPSTTQVAARNAEAMAYLRSILMRWLQHMHCCKRSPSRFCYHFYFLTFFLLNFFLFLTFFTFLFSRRKVQWEDDMIRKE